MVVAYLPKERVVFQGDLFFLPANDAPTTAPIAASSSSVCRHVPPIFGSHSASSCRISVEGVIG